MTRSKPSKTALKREQQALQSLGERLIGLSEEELGKLPIDARLIEAVLAASTVHARGALRRQKQLIGKLMRDVDPELVHTALLEICSDDRGSKRLFTDAERWRNRLLRDGEQAVEACSESTGARVPVLKQLLSELLATSKEREEKRIRRQIFRTLHDALAARQADDRIPR